MSVWSRIKGFFGADREPTVPDPSAPASSTPEQFFAAEVERALVETGARIVRHLPDSFGIVATRGDQEFTVFLDNVFRETREVGPEERRARIAGLVSTGTEKIDDISWEDAQLRLVPVLRSSLMLAYGARWGAKPMLQRRFLPFLAEAVALDSPRAIQIVGRSTADSWGVAAEEVFRHATANLAASAVALVPFDPEVPFPNFAVANDDSYESSRLLIPGWLASFKGKVHGNPIAAVPDRAMLLIGGDGDDACIKRMLDAAGRQYASSTRRISPALYTVDAAGVVVPFHAAPGHQLEGEVELAHVTLAMTEYQDQQEGLQERLGSDVFVASYLANQTDAGEVWSFCVWTRGVPSLLPRTSHVMLTDPDVEGRPRRVPWSEVESCLTEEPEIEPPRFRTGEWPGE